MPTALNASERRSVQTYCHSFPRQSGNLLVCQATAGDELGGDDVALDFVGALADDHQRGVAEVSFDVKLGGVAVTAVDAHRVERDFHGGLRREQLGHARLEVAAGAGVQSPSGMQDEL